MYVNIIISIPKKIISMTVAFCSPLKGNWPTRLSLGPDQKKCINDPAQLTWLSQSGYKLFLTIENSTSIRS
jgi:hypothetical protein